MSTGMCSAWEERWKLIEMQFKRGRRLHNDQLNLCENHGLSKLNEIWLQNRTGGTKCLCEGWTLVVPSASVHTKIQIFHVSYNTVYSDKGPSCWRAVTKLMRRAPEFKHWTWRWSWMALKSLPGCVCLFVNISEMWICEKKKKKENNLS